MTPGTLQGPIRRGKPFQNQKNMTGKKPGNHFICFSKNPSQKNNLSKKNKHHMTNWQLPSFLTKGTCKGTTGSPCCRWWIGSQNRWIHLTHLCGHGATPKWPTSLKVNQGNKKNYFTSSDPHHDMLGGGCQVRVVIENMMGRMENLKTLISGFLGLVILVRWALVTMFLSWTTQTGCRIHRTYVSLIGSGEGRHTTHLLKCVLLLSTSQTDWKQSSDVLSDISFDILSDKSSDISSDILSDISSDILSDIFLTYLLTFFLTNLLTLFLTYLLTFFLTYLSTCFLTYLLTFFLTYQNQNLTSTASHKKPLCKLYIYLTPRSKSNIHDNFVPVNVIALSASDRPAKRQLSPKMQNACSSTHTHTPHASDRPAKQQLSPKMQKSLKCHNYISWRVQTMKSDARHCGSSAGSA